MKKIIYVLICFIIFCPVAFAETSCISSVTVSGKNQRTSDFNSEWNMNGSYTGSLAKGCEIKYVTGNENVVKVKTENSTFYFSPQGTGTTTVTVTVPSKCTCSGAEIKKTAYFNFSEWGLQSLSIDGYELSPTFNKDNFDYTINAPADLEEVSLSLAPNEQGATIKVNNIAINGLSTTTKIINDKILIKVTTSTGRNDTITVNVKRTSSPSSSTASTASSIKEKSSNNNSTPPKSVAPKKEEKENPETGMIGMIFYWIISITLMSYTLYYLKKFTTTSHEE